MPKPELYVIYTGNKGRKPDTISLSQEFFDGADIDIEIKANVIYAYVDYKEKEADWEKRYGGDNPKGYKESLYERLKNQSERTTEYRQQNADKNKGRGAR